MWPSLGGRDKAGQGVIVGILDTGIWPEHPMLKDVGLAAPAGGPWKCDFGDGSLGAAFTCNNKLIGAYAFLDGYQTMAANVGSAAEYCAGKVCTARDADGHGTHTATTAAGSYTTSAPVLGTERGPVSGVAPGAAVIAYRVCGEDGCYNSDSVAAVEQAILDGVDVINFSIGGGAAAYSDPVELAFLDAYAAGITVNASAGNSGPGAGTAEHAGPWVTTVGASTSDRAFTSALVLTAPTGETYVKQGATITSGVTDGSVVLATAVPGYAGSQFCTAPFPAGSLTGQVVVCTRGGNARVEKGYFAAQAGAAGMILINPVASDVQTDNHFLPAIHLEGPNADLLAFVAAHPGVTATWAQGQATVAPGDVMAGFSSRGPVGDYLKPDVTAPGIQVLAGHTPTPATIPGGPAGQLFQAIAGTSMSSPHAAGVSALVKAAHPSWTPGQIKSALMTSSLQSVVNVDGSTAGVFDRGAGSIRADRAVSPVLTISETAADFLASAGDADHRIDLNIASVYTTVLPGAVDTKRTVTNVSGKKQTFTVSATGADGLRISVVPARFTLAAGKSRDLTIIVDGLNAGHGWHEGRITITPSSGNRVVLPVAANVREAQLSLTQVCEPTTIARNKTTTCTVEAINNLPVGVTASIDVASNPLLQTRSVTAPASKTALGAKWSGTLAPALAPSITGIVPDTSPGDGYLPLSVFDEPNETAADPIPFTDDQIRNFAVPEFKFGGDTYTSIGVVSNGYIVVGGGRTSDVVYEPNGFPNADSPNNVLAPLWTDLSPHVSGAIRALILTDGVDDWIVIDWSEVPTWDGEAENSFQVWIQVGGTEGIWYSYGADAVGDSGSGALAGAENRDGTSGVELPLPSQNSSYAVLTAPAEAGGAVTFDYTLKGLAKGTWKTWVALRSPALNAIPMEQTKITVK